MKYSIVIPTYNHCDDLLKPCIESIVKYTDLDQIELIVIANGCKDETEEYLAYMSKWFANRNGCLVYSVHEEPLGYAKATNIGIKLATTDLIVLLNNDTILMEQPKNMWLQMMEQPFLDSEKCGISCPVKVFSDAADGDFAIFFCTMIHRKVFESIGYLNEEYGTGSGEDVEFCILAQRAGWTVEQCSAKNEVRSGLWGGGLPIYHVGEGTVHDVNLVQNWNDIFWRNHVRLARKFNPAWYQKEFGGDQDRYAVGNGHEVEPKAIARYQWVAERLYGTKVLEIGCSNGYGTQFLPKNIDYLGIDKDEKSIAITSEEHWGESFSFRCADIYNFNFGDMDTIVALNFVHLLTDGMQLIEYLKTRCKVLLISVPYRGRRNSRNTQLKYLDEQSFPGAAFWYVDEYGHLYNEPADDILYMLCEWRKV